MSTNPYSEDHLVEQPAIQRFADLEWLVFTRKNGSVP
jgi:hypothetical protein